MGQLNRAAAAYNDRLDDQRFLHALHASWIVSMWTTSGGAIDPRMLFQGRTDELIAQAEENER